MTVADMLAGVRRALSLPVRPSEAPVPDMPASGVVSVSRSHVGAVRAINEDRVLERPDAGLWAVVDGMGGHAAGDVAAETVLGLLDRLADEGAPSPDAVAKTISAANAALRERAIESGRMSGATAVVLLRDEAGCTVFWVGDCRAYRLRGEDLAQLTRDHSVVQELVDAGTLTPEQAARHPHAHVVTRALGAADTVEIDRAAVEMGGDDLVLLCSDGLARSAAGLARLNRGGGLDAVADSLLATALTVDGSDNISLVLIGAGFRG